MDLEALDAALEAAANANHEADASPERANTAPPSDALAGGAPTPARAPVPLCWQLLPKRLLLIW